ncbi:MAG: hypothetical protein K5906_03955 [Bacilli bacterium]|nr:hypothetical protein [Bacilli bacterium]
MLRKNKHLSRCYLCAYLAWALGCWIPPLLLSRDSGALAIVFVIVSCVVFAALVVSHVFKNRNNEKVFTYTSLPALGLVLILSIFGLVLEGIFTSQGQAAPWPWMAGGVALFLSILMCLAYYFGMKRIKKPEEII